ncbi:hypothetical protein [Streptomyces sp. NPDC047973]|uniref:hypothetical protein n=1 Tax=Streptomyces sp. NPDC047973 TaxID=3155383 RepID=UPI00341C83A6
MTRAYRERAEEANDAQRGTGDELPLGHRFDRVPGGTGQDPRGGADEAGKTAVHRAFKQANPPTDQRDGLDALRDHPRSRCTELDRGDKEAGDVLVTRATFTLDDDDIAALHDVDDKPFADAKTLPAHAISR